MNRIGEAGQGLDRVELVLEFATALHLGQVLSLVDEERFWPPMNQAAFQSQTKLNSRHNRITERSAAGAVEGRMRRICQLSVDKRFLERDQRPPIVVLPTELAGIRRWRFQADYRHDAGVLTKCLDHRLSHMLFHSPAQRCLTHPSRAVDEDQ